MDAGPPLAARWHDTPPAGWDALVREDPAAGPAQRAAVAMAFAAVLPGMAARFLAVERGGELVGGLPLVIERRGGLRWLHALPFLLSGAPRAPPGDREAVDHVAGAALAALQRSEGAVGGAWAACRTGGEPVAQDALALASGETRWMESAVVDLAAGLAAAGARVDRKTRAQIRRARGRFALSEEPEALEEAWALHVAQSRAWPGYRPRPLELSRRLLAPAGDGLGPAARLFCVRDGAGLLAATLVLDHPRELLPWWSGAHPQARERQASALLLWSVVERAHETGRARVNLGASAGLAALAGFKGTLGATPLRWPVRWLDARHAPAAGRWAAALQGLVRRGRARGEPA